MKLHPMVVKTTLKALLLLAIFAKIATSTAQGQMQVYGLWHCYTDACSWASVPDMTLFDTNNHWIIDRGDGHPSVNVVVLSFVNPAKVMNLTTDSGDVNGIPIGMNTAVVNYFQSKGVRVMMSIGGISYTKDWTKALGTNPTQLGINAANAAKQFNVGMEIDYEKSSNPNLTGLQQFVTAYRLVVPYDATGSTFAARLTIDLGDGDLYLTALANYATTADDRFGRRRSVSDCAGQLRNHELAQNDESGIGLRQCHGGLAKDHCFQLGEWLAAAHQRRLRLGSTAGSGQTYRKPLGGWQFSHRQLHELQRFGSEHSS